MVEPSAGGAPENYYNLLVQGFRAGRLSVNKPVPPELARIAVPYDPALNAAGRLPWHDLEWAQVHRVHDLSYYRGRFHLYFGVTPALVLLWPYAAVTGHYLLHEDSAVFFFSLGFLAGAGLLCALWRRCFAEISIWVMIAGTLALGLAGFIPSILPYAEVYEVPISCGYALTMLALVLLWRAMQAGRRRAWWLAVASLAYGLALGARPSLLLGAIILLVPVAQAWREQQRVWPLLLGATGPIMLLGLGLMLYNALRFGDPLEFGQRYQLPVSAHRQFSPAYLWFNFQVGLLEPARWTIRFPFVRDIAVPPFPGGYFDVRQAFGVLSTVPLVWLALAVPLGWRGAAGEALIGLRGFFAGVALLFGACALVLGLHDSMHVRYQVEYAALLLLLAVAGIFGLERALLGRRFWLPAARWGWGLLLAFSVAFNLLAICAPRADAVYNLGVAALRQGRVDKAISCFRGALEIRPSFAEAHNNLGALLLQAGRLPEAIEHHEAALRLKPADAMAHLYLGTALQQQGKVPEAIAHYEAALRLRPEDGKARNNLGVALWQMGEKLAAQGKWGEAIGQYERSVALMPDNAQAHDSWGMALTRVARPAEAVVEYEKALAIGPALVSARNNLAWLLATCADGSVRNGTRAVDLAEGANQVVGGKDPAILDTLAAAYAEVERFGDAVRTAQKAVELAQGAGQVEQARQMQARLQLYQAGRPYHEGSGFSP